MRGQECSMTRGQDGSAMRGNATTTNLRNEMVRGTNIQYSTVDKLKFNKSKLSILVNVFVLVLPLVQWWPSIIKFLLLSSINCLNDCCLILSPFNRGGVVISWPSLYFCISFFWEIDQCSHRFKWHKPLPYALQASQECMHWCLISSYPLQMSPCLWMCKSGAPW